MTLPSSSQCCRAVRRRLRPQYDSIWIPDSLLATAFDRYCASFRNPARYGSSVPGPMENRRRLGKRHMGELNFGHSHPAAPLWEFESLADLTQWKWKPPTSPDSIVRYHGEYTPKSRRYAVWEKLRQVLFPGSSTHARSGHAQSSEDEVFSQNTFLGGVAEYQALPTPVWDAQSTPSDVVTVGLELLLSDLSTPLAKVGSMPNLANFCSSWRNGLVGGLFSGEDVRLVLKGIKKGLDAENPATNQPLLLESVKICLYDATIKGICRREPQDPIQFDHLLWGDILQHTSELRMNNIRIFTKAMACIPDCELGKMLPGIIANLKTQIRALGRATKRSTWARQAAKMATILERLEDTNRRDVLDTVTHWLSLYAGTRELNFARSRFGWLHVLARLPGLNKELAQVCCFLESNTASAPLSRTEICHLFLARLNSRDAASQISLLYNIYNRPAIIDSLSYRLLSRGLWRTHQHHHVRTMFQFLHYLGREYGVLQLAKGIRSSVSGDISSLANMAIGMRKPSLAIEIYDLFDASGREPEQFWRSASAAKALRCLVNARGLKHHKFMETLNVVPFPHGKRGIRQGENCHMPATPATPMLGATSTEQHRKPTLSIRQILKTTRAATALARTPILSRRKAFALITECVKYLKSYDVSLPPNIIRAIIHNVTRDLAEGRPGRSLRLRWLLHLLREEFGEGEMFRTGMSLKRWRDFNFRRSRARSGRHVRWSRFPYGRERTP